MAELPSGYVRILLERPRHPALAAAAQALAVGEDPADIMARYEPERGARDDLIIDREFGAVPIGEGRTGADFDFSVGNLHPDKSKKFLVRAFIARPRQEIPTTINKDPVYSDPPIHSSFVCGTSRPVGTTADVRYRLDTTTLAKSGLDGSGVAIAIVDTGIFLPRLTKVIGTAPPLDAALSWRAPKIVSRPGHHRIGHGTMCAYDALIAAPKATLIDVPMLLARALGDHSAQGTAGAAMQAYWWLIYHWLIAPQSTYRALVASNSWGVLHPSLDVLPLTHPGRFIDNPGHIFRLFIGLLAQNGVDIVFAASNCGAECPSAVCLRETAGMIMAANAYPEVLTLAACDTKGIRAGYSSQGPSVANMPPKKPDLTAYAHFLGSKARRSYIPDSGTSASCAVAAGCVAALRTRLAPAATPPAVLFQTLTSTALPVGGPGWNPDYGYGIIRPVEAGVSLGLIP